MRNETGQKGRSLVPRGPRHSINLQEQAITYTNFCLLSAWDKVLNRYGDYIFTHINGYPSAAGQAQASEKLPVKDRRSSTELHHQLGAMPHGTGTYHYLAVRAHCILLFSFVRLQLTFANTFLHEFRNTARESHHERLQLASICFMHRCQILIVCHSHLCTEQYSINSRPVNPYDCFSCSYGRRCRKKYRIIYMSFKTIYLIAV